MALLTCFVLVPFLLVTRAALKQSAWAPTTEGALQSNQSETEVNPQCPVVKVYSNLTIEHLKEVQPDTSGNAEDGIGLGYFSPGAMFTLKGEVVTWGNWKQSLSEFTDPHKNCVYIDEDLMWVPAMCNETHYGLCEMEKRRCKHDEDSSYCKWIFYPSSTMEVMEKHCQKGQSSLAVFTKNSWEQFLKSNSLSVFKTYIIKYGVWIGVRRNQVNWGSITGNNLSWSNWNSGEPQLDGNKRCAVMELKAESSPLNMNDFKWSSEDCSNTHNAVLCEGRCKESSVKQCLHIINTTISTNSGGITELCKKNSMKTTDFSSLIYNFDGVDSILAGVKIWISVTNRLWYSLSGKRLTYIPWEENTTPSTIAENKHCAKAKVYQNKDFPDILRTEFVESSCIVDKSEAIPGLCFLSSVGTQFIKKTQESHKNINDAHRACRNMGGELAVPSFFMVISAETFIPGEEFWIGITDDPRFWYNSSGDVEDIFAMGTYEENCLKAVVKGDGKFEVSASRCILDCTDDPPATTDKGVTAADESNYCECKCPKELNETALSEEIAKIKEAVKKALVLEKKNLSASTRRYQSAPDYRPSAQYLGSTAIVLLVFTAAIVVTPDLIDMIHYVKKKCSKF